MCVLGAVTYLFVIKAREMMGNQKERVARNTSAVGVVCAH